MNWIIIITLTVLVLATIALFIIILHQWNFFYQVLYAFICDHENWKRYQRLKKYLKNNIIPLINLIDFRENNDGFAFVQYDNIIFITQGEHVYLHSYYEHLIKDLLTRNNHDS